MTSCPIWLPFHSKVATGLVLFNGFKVLLFRYINNSKISFSQESHTIFVITITRSVGYISKRLRDTIFPDF